jgi:hypothetical protein
MMSEAAAQSRDVQNPYAATAVDSAAGPASQSYSWITKMSALLGATSILSLASMIAYVASVAGEVETTRRMVLTIGGLVCLSMLSGLVGFVLGVIGAYMGAAKRLLTWFALISNSIILLILLAGIALKLASGQPFFPN